LKKIPANLLDPLLLEGVSVPNLVALPFAVNEACAELIYNRTSSPRLSKVLRKWDEERWDAPERRQTLCCLLLLLWSPPNASVQKQSLDTAAQVYAQRVDISLFTGGGGSTGGSSSAQIQTRLDNIALEHGDTYIDGIQPVFDALKARHFDSSRNWVRQDTILMFYDILCVQSLRRTLNRWPSADHISDSVNIQKIQDDVVKLWNVVKSQPEISEEQKNRIKAL
jgi:Fatty acid synthase type I helical domain